MSVDLFLNQQFIETVCLLSKLSEAKHHISVQVDMEELDVTATESKATRDPGVGTGKVRVPCDSSEYRSGKA